MGKCHVLVPMIAVCLVGLTHGNEFFSEVGPNKCCSPSDSNGPLVQTGSLLNISLEECLDTCDYLSSCLGIQYSDNDNATPPSPYATSCTLYSVSLSPMGQPCGGTLTTSSVCFIKATGSSRSTEGGDVKINESNPDGNGESNGGGGGGSPATLAIIITAIAVAVVIAVSVAIVIATRKRQLGTNDGLFHEAQLAVNPLARQFPGPSANNGSVPSVYQNEHGDNATRQKKERRNGSGSGSGDVFTVQAPPLVAHHTATRNPYDNNNIRQHSDKSYNSQQQNTMSSTSSSRASSPLAPIEYADVDEETEQAAMMEQEKRALAAERNASLLGPDTDTLVAPPRIPTRHGKPNHTTSSDGSPSSLSYSSSTMSSPGSTPPGHISSDKARSGSYLVPVNRRPRKGVDKGRTPVASYMDVPDEVHLAGASDADNNSQHDSGGNDYEYGAAVSRHLNATQQQRQQAEADQDPTYEMASGSGNTQPTYSRATPGKGISSSTTYGLEDYQEEDEDVEHMYEDASAVFEEIYSNARKSVYMMPEYAYITQQQPQAADQQQPQAPQLTHNERLAILMKVSKGKITTEQAEAEISALLQRKILQHELNQISYGSPPAENPMLAGKITDQNDHDLTEGFYDNRGSNDMSQFAGDGHLLKRKGSTTSIGSVRGFEGMDIDIDED